MPYRSTRVSVSLTRRKAGFAKFVTDMSPTPRCHESAPGVTNVTNVTNQRAMLLLIESVFRRFVLSRSPLAANGPALERPFLPSAVTYRRLLLPIARRCYISGHKSLSLHC